ncbi:hypothetical protein CCO03_08375 [Comamonas serinivorans]|uniref:Uncharacterized protein n=1 Tax=Comamonas serinivorans TaxID=1082851 RepID=A0A1Y0EMZ8_9BURK|nr:hypothetical protein [Comamonas serinivorans]ARU04689.1 hypothetical protein CCO03_08375 [Comamonas serinivorans]
MQQVEEAARFFGSLFGSGLNIRHWSMTFCWFFWYAAKLPSVRDLASAYRSATVLVTSSTTSSTVPMAVTNCAN